ncbi:hypothetical protein, partial [Paenibacillus oceani]
MRRNIFRISAVLLLTGAIMSQGSLVFSEKSNPQDTTPAALTEKDLEAVENTMRFKKNFFLEVDEANVKGIIVEEKYSPQALKYLGVHLTEAEFEEIKKRKSIINKAKTVAATIDKESFGGMYYDHEKNKLFIGLVPNEKIDTLTDAFLHEAPDRSRLNFYTVNNSYEELINKRPIIDRFLLENNVPASFSALSVPSNKIQVAFESEDLIRKYESLFDKRYIELVKGEKNYVTKLNRTTYYGGTRSQDRFFRFLRCEKMHKLYSIYSRNA